MGAAISHLDGKGSQLVKAVKSGDACLVTELISAHPHLIEYANLRQFTALHYAAKHSNLEVLQQLCSKAEELEFMQQLAEHGRLGCAHPHGLVARLVNAYSDRGVTPLMLAAESGCIESVQLLLTKGADPWAIDKLGGRTALHYAARSDDVDVLQALISAAGDRRGPVKFPNRPNTRFVDVRTQSGFTALHFAVHGGCQQSLAVLLNAGANPMLSSLFDCLECINCPKGSTALHLAARVGNMDASKQLIKAYIDHWHHRHMPDPRLIMDGDDALPCQVALRRQHPALARMLLPSTPLASVLGDGELTILGPPRLAQIAGAVLRLTMEQELQHIQQGTAGVTDRSVEHAELIEEPDSEQGELQQADYSDGLQETCMDDLQRETQHECAALAASVVPEQVPDPDVDSKCSAMCRTCSIDCASSCDSEDLCGVCFESQPLAVLQPCKHQLCVSCCAHLLGMPTRCVLSCPFCRAGVRHFTAVAVVPDAAPVVAAVHAWEAVPAL